MSKIVRKNGDGAMKEGDGLVKETEGEYFDLFRAKRLKAAFYIAGITIGCIGVAFALGLAIDSFFDTKPLGLVLVLIVSFPLTQIVAVKFLRKKLHLTNG